VYIVIFLLVLIVPFMINKTDGILYLWSGQRYLWMLEGVTGVVTINWDKNQAGGGVYVNGQYMSALPDHLTCQAGCVSFILAHREKVLVLGLGRRYDSRTSQGSKIKQIDIVDWSYELPKNFKPSCRRALLNHVLSILSDPISDRCPRGCVAVWIKKIWCGGRQSGDYQLGRVYQHKISKIFQEISRILKPEGVYILDINADRRYSFNGVLAVCQEISIL